MANNKPKHILIAPLDWGLGHTTRCVPVISYILSLGHSVTFAGNKTQRKFIEEIFPAIDFIHLEGYHITYSVWNKYAQMGLLSQLPAISKAIKAEHEWLRQLSFNRKIDGVISDNRYGLYHDHIPSVIMTHQLQVQSGLGNIADSIIKKIHYKYLERFDTTWVVDTPGIPNLSGRLSHPATMPQHAAYIGLLSRFPACHPAGICHPEHVEGPLVILLSGPEPQRTILSRILWQQCLRYNGKVIFIEGSEHAVTPGVIPQHIIYYQRPTHQQLAPLLHEAGMVICRSGYSTLMDLIALGKKAIVIPTPGQTEQQYLARGLHQTGIFYSAKQKSFDLMAALKAAQHFLYNIPELQSSYTMHQPVIMQWLEAITAKKEPPGGSPIL